MSITRASIPSRKKAGVPQSAAAEVQAVYEVGAVSGGNWKATGTPDAGGSAQTGNIAWNANPATVIAAFAAVGITVTMSGNTQYLAGNALVLTFPVAGAKALLTIDSSGLTGGGSYAAARLTAYSTGDFVGAAAGDLAMDTTTGTIYRNTGTASAPIWAATGADPSQYLSRGAALLIGCGDSITVGSSTGSFPTAATVNLANTLLVSDKNWLHWAAMFSGGAVRVVGNTGFSGDTSAHILTRIAHLQYLIAQYPTNSVYVTVMAGTNDINLSVAYATTIANIKAIYAAIYAAGGIPIACTIPPINGRTTGQDQAANKLNLWIKENARRSRMLLFDAYSVVVDQANGNYKSGYNADTLHPSPTGANALGSSLWTSVLQNRTPSAAIWLPTSANDGAVGGISLMPNPLFADGNSDGIADSWSNGSGANCTPSIITGDAAIFGNWQRVTFAASRFPFMTTTATITTGFSPGDRLLFVCRLTQVLNNATQQGAAIIKWNWVGGTGGSVAPVNSWVTDVANQVIAAEAVVPPGVTAINPQVVIDSTTSTAGPYVQFAQMAILNLTTLGLT